MRKKKEVLEAINIVVPKDLKAWFIEYSNRQGRSLTKQIALLMQEFRQTRLDG
jgi:hypothetical protein